MKKEDIKKKLAEKGVEFTENNTTEELAQKLKEAVGVKSESTPFVLMEVEDDHEILAEIQGAVLDAYVYSFRQGDKEVIGLSKAGVEAVCRESADKKGEAYRVIDYKVEEDADYVKVIVKSGRYRIIDTQGDIREILIDTAIGAKRQSKNIRGRDGRVTPNPFAFEVAISKAQRNAKMSLLPHKFITEMMKRFRKDGNVRTVMAGAKVTPKQIGFLHAIATESGVSHEKLAELIKKEFGYEHINQLEMSQVNRVAELLRNAKTSLPPIPTEVKKLFEARGFTLPAKQEALWAKALSVSNNDVWEATDAVKEGRV